MVAIPLAVVACLVAPNLAQVPDRVGRITIEGNTDTPDGIILGYLNLRPGQILKYPSIKSSTLDLIHCQLFDLKSPPTVEVVPNEFDSTFKDIRVRVKERAGNWIIFATTDAAWAIVTLDSELMQRTAVTVLVRSR